MRILGIDPGFGRIGFGVVEQQGGRVRWIYHTCLQTDTCQDFSLRLQMLRDETNRVAQTFQPQCAAIEKLFFQKNVTTAIQVGMARGVILLVLADVGIPIVEMTPNQVKQGVAGYGSADKKQVQTMVCRLLGLKETPKPDDAADALAIAIVGGAMFRR